MEQERTVWRYAAWIVGLWLLAHVVLVAGHVLHVLVYSLAIAPGLENTAYEAYANESAPWFSIAFGGPVFYAIGRMLTSRLSPHGRRAGLTVWGLYSVADLTIVLLVAVSIPGLLVAQWIASQGIKLAAVLLATKQPQHS